MKLDNSIFAVSSIGICIFVLFFIPPVSAQSANILGKSSQPKRLTAAPKPVNCPRVQILRKNKEVLLRIGSDETKLVPGVTRFSADCRYVWSAKALKEYPQTPSLIYVYRTDTGHQQSAIDGFFPIWTLSGDRLFFLKGYDTIELWQYDASTRRETKILERADYWNCPQIGDETIWQPVEPLSNGMVRWIHGVTGNPDNLPKEKGPNDGSAAVILTIDPNSKKIIRKEWTQIICG